MTAAWFVGANHSVPQDQNEVRTTIEPIRTDGPAEERSDPDWNELDTDDSGQLVGLSPRQLSGLTNDMHKYPAWWSGLASENHNVIIDDQVASSGTAAKREMAGEQGHGTMQYEVSIDPLLRDGAAFGNDYFAAHDAPIQDGAGEYMAPTDQDNWLSAVVQARAVDNERKAFQSTRYNNFLSGR